MVDFSYRLWLVKKLATLVLPPVGVTLAGVKLFASIAGSAVPNRTLLVAICSLSVPLWVLVSARLAQIENARRALEAGCMQAPLVVGKRFANLDIAKRYGA
jgi:hypothetical protein